VRGENAKGNFTFLLFFDISLVSLGLEIPEH
jgi:hypothetical protein